jgi:hypothetical protein
MTDPIKQTAATEEPNLSTERQNERDARRPNDTLNKDTPSTEGQNAQSENHLSPKRSRIALLTRDPPA